MVTTEQIKALEERQQALYTHLHIEDRRLELDEQEALTHDPNFWDDPAKAEAQLKKVAGIKYWITAYDAIASAMEELRALAPDSITVHSLAVKRAARLKLFRDTYEEMGFQNSQEIMDLTYRYCVEQGAYPYYLYRQKNMAGNFENVGYAKDRKAGIYNILIMEEKQTILAAGAGASSKFVFAADHIERVENVKDVAQYIDRIDEMIERKRSFMEAHGLLEQG